MKFDEKPDANYHFTKIIYTDNVWDFINQVEALDPETPLCHTTKTQLASRGAWLREGTFELGRGSFIDPNDLMLYVDDFYRYREDGAGAIEGVELVGSSYMPEGALSAGNAGELLDRLVEIDYVEPEEDSELSDAASADCENTDDTAVVAEAVSADTDDEDRAETVEEAADDRTSRDSDDEINATMDEDVSDSGEGTDEQDESEQDEPTPGKLADLTLFQPDDASEKRGALAPRWKLMLYRAADESELAVIV